MDRAGVVDPQPEVSRDLRQGQVIDNFSRRILARLGARELTRPPVTVLGASVTRLNTAT